MYAPLEACTYLLSEIGSSDLDIVLRIMKTPISSSYFLVTKHNKK